MSWASAVIRDHVGIERMLGGIVTALRVKQRGRPVPRSPALVHLGVNTTTEIKPGSLWRHLLQDFCRDLLVSLPPIFARARVHK